MNINLDPTLNPFTPADALRLRFASMEELQDGLNILWDDGETYAGVALSNNGQTWLLAENSHYYPIGAAESEDDEVPFGTYGTQQLVDVTAGTFIEREFEAEEGQIQGLVYALSAMKYGGQLPKEKYEEYIIELINKLASDYDYEHQPLAIKLIEEILSKTTQKFVSQ